MTDLLLAWQDATTRAWFPIGRLARRGTRYQFGYTQGALDAQKAVGFQPLVSFPEFGAIYESDEIFPLFANRVPAPSRPDYDSFVECLNLAKDRDDPIALLARSGGRRRTDTLEVFPEPERDLEDRYHLHFFAHGLSHLPRCAVERAGRLQAGERLLLMHDFQNPRDPNGWMLRTAENAGPDDVHIVGYLPRYLVEELALLRESGAEPSVTVERMNPAPMPLQLRVLCSLTAPWPKGFQPFARPAYRLIVEGGRSAEAALAAAQRARSATR